MACSVVASPAAISTQRLRIQLQPLKHLSKRGFYIFLLLFIWLMHSINQPYLNPHIEDPVSAVAHTPSILEMQGLSLPRAIRAIRRHRFGEGEKRGGTITHASQLSKILFADVGTFLLIPSDSLRRSTNQRSNWRIFSRFSFSPPRFWTVFVETAVSGSFFHQV